MNVMETIQALYSIMCESENICSGDDKSTERLKFLLKSVSDSDVQQAIHDFNHLCGSLSNVNDNLKNMYLHSLHSGFDEITKQIILISQAHYGNSIILFTTAVSETQAQNICDAISMSIKMSQAGDSLHISGGRA